MTEVLLDERHLVLVPVKLGRTGDTQIVKAEGLILRHIGSLELPETNLHNMAGLVVCELARFEFAIEVFLVHVVFKELLGRVPHHCCSLLT